LVFNIPFKKGNRNPLELALATASGIENSSFCSKSIIKSSKLLTLNFLYNLGY
jgi:hypothetical protein